MPFVVWFSQMFLSKFILSLEQEPIGGAHADPNWTSQQIKIAINEAMSVSFTGGNCSTEINFVKAYADLEFGFFIV